MFEVIFYRDKSGRSDIVEFLDQLGKMAVTSKRDRIDRGKILTYIAALATYGLRLGQPMIKHIDGDIWELRPLSNRIFFFYWKNNKFVLLHHFIKKSQKTPQKELNKARIRLNDFIERNGERDG